MYALDDDEPVSELLRTNIASLTLALKRDLAKHQGLGSCVSSQCGLLGREYDLCLRVFVCGQEEVTV